MVTVLILFYVKKRNSKEHLAAAITPFFIIFFLNV